MKTFQMIILMIISSCAFAATATVSVGPASKTINTFDTFTLDIRVDDVVNLHGAQVRFTFDPTLIECQGIVAGSFLTGTLSLPPLPTPAPGVGSILLNQAILGVGGNTGSGVLWTITFRPLSGPGSTTLALSDVALAKYEAGTISSIPFTSSDGLVVLEGALPITLSAFAVHPSPDSKGVFVSWGTTSEVNNFGFWLQRRGSGAPEFVDVPNSFQPGQGNTLIPHQYSFTDETLPSSGSFEYRLRSQDLDGTLHYSNVVSISVVLTGVNEVAPKMFDLEQNYPNPFNPSTTISYSLPARSFVSLSVYNSLGQRVAELVRNSQEAGRYNIRFDANSLASGVYLYRLVAGSSVMSKKLMLVR